MRTWIAICAIAFTLSSPAAAGELTPEARDCFEWFSTLGFPDIKDAPWAEIYEGAVLPSAQGFVLSDTKTDIRILTSELTDTTIQKIAPANRAKPEIKYQEGPFHPSPSQLPFNAALDPKAERFFLAFACWRKGNDRLAQELFDEAARIPPGIYAVEQTSPANLPMRLELECELGRTALWDGVLRFGAERLGEWYRQTSALPMSRSDLLELFRNIVHHYPTTPYFNRAQDIVAVLENMVAEDTAHVWLTPEEIAKLPLDQQVDEWIFRLRDQTGRQFDILDQMNGESNGVTTAHQLLKIGYPAVPKLIEALGDERFARAIWYDSLLSFSPHILRVNDCALRILARIAYRDFPGAHSGEEKHASEMIPSREIARAWWRDFQTRGEEATLVEALASGKEAPTELFPKLREKYPDTATDALLRGARNVRVVKNAGAFMSLVGEIKSQEATDVLLGKMNGDDCRAARSEAAIQLMNRDHPAALNAALSVWNSKSATATIDPPFSRLTPLDFLIASGTADSIRSVVKDWEKRPTDQRFQILRSLGKMMRVHRRTSAPVAGLLEAGAGDKPGELIMKPPEEKAKDLAIKLFGQALDDTAIKKGYGGYFGGYEFHDLRICDLALCELHTLQPTTYAFSPKASPEQRETERYNAAAQWRRDHEQPDLRK